MNSTRFDQIVRTFAAIGSRRGFLAALGGLAALTSQRARANQAPPSCGSTGDVCTMLLGCCAGLTCATSAINPSYGVCVPGEGAMTTSGTALVLPFDGDDAAAAQTVVDSTTTTDTTTTTLEDRQAEIEARKAEKQSRKASRKSEQQSRRDTQQARRQDNREERDLRNGPDLSFRVINPGAKNGVAEIVRVTNEDSTNVVLFEVSSVLNPDNGTSPTTPPVISVGRSLSLRSGVQLPNEANPEQANELTWSQQAVCTEDAGSGFLIVAAFSTGTESTDYEVFCDGTVGSGGHRRKRNRRKNKNQKSRDKGK